MDVKMYTERARGRPEADDLTESPDEAVLSLQGGRAQLHLRLSCKDVAFLRSLAAERGQTLSGCVGYLLRVVQRRVEHGDGEARGTATARRRR